MGTARAQEPCDRLSGHKPGFAWTENTGAVACLSLLPDGKALSPSMLLTAETDPLPLARGLRPRALPSLAPPTSVKHATSIGQDSLPLAVPMMVARASEALIRRRQRGPCSLHLALQPNRHNPPVVGRSYSTHVAHDCQNRNLSPWDEEDDDSRGGIWAS